MGNIIERYILGNNWHEVTMVKEQDGTYFVQSGNFDSYGDVYETKNILKAFKNFNKKVYLLREEHFEMLEKLECKDKDE